MFFLSGVAATFFVRCRTVVFAMLASYILVADARADAGSIW